MQKTIFIFLASSIIECEHERMALSNFIHEISDIFEAQYDVRIRPVLCENMDSAFSLSRKQEEYNEKIRKSDFCFFLFYTRAGRYTLEEFEIARQQFAATGKPKIYTYFKQLTAPEQPEQSLVDFMHQLEETHYPSVFSHTDTIKLRILQCLKMQEMDFLDMRVENGRFMVDNREMMSLDNVSEFANNAALAQLQKELSAAQDTLLTLQAQKSQHNGDEEFNAQILKAERNVKNLQDLIGDQRAHIFNVSLQMVNDTAHGEISLRQKKAYQLFEQGDFEGCIAVLNVEDIDNDFAIQRARLKEQDLLLCRKYIREHKTAIDLLTAMGDRPERRQEIEARYQKILPTIFEMNVELDAVQDYIEFLITCKKDEQAFALAERLLTCYEDKSKKANTLRNLARTCDHLRNRDKAIEYVLQSIAIREELAAENPREHLPALAQIYNNAAIIYHKQHNWKFTEEYALKSIAIREELMRQDPNRHAFDLSVSYSNMGIFCERQRQWERALELHLKAVALREDVAKKDPALTTPDLARSYNNTADVYAQLNQPDNAVTYYNKAVALQEELAKENPELYRHDLSESYRELGDTYCSQGNYAAAEKCYTTALSILDAMVAAGKTQYRHELAFVYDLLGSFYRDQCDYGAAEKCYTTAVSICEAMVADGQKHSSDDLASAYNQLGNFYRNQRDYDAAEKCYTTALSIWEAMVADGKTLYRRDLAFTYDHLGDTYRDKGDYVAAEQCYATVVSIGEAIAADNPSPLRLLFCADCYENMARFYLNYGARHADAAVYLQKEIAIYEKLSDVYADHASRYVPRAARAYHRLSVCTQDAALRDKAVALAQQYPESPISQSVIEAIEQP